MVSTRSLISKSSCPCINPLVTEPSAPITIGTIVTFMFHGPFNSLARSWYLSFFSLFFTFILSSTGTAKSTIRQLLLCLSLGMVVWLRLCDPFLSQNPREFVRFSLLDGFWVVHIPFVCMVKFKYLAQFPVVGLPHSVVSSILLFLC